jgi:hypothetical protein
LVREYLANKLTRSQVIANSNLCTSSSPISDNYGVFVGWKSIYRMEAV